MSKSFSALSRLCKTGSPQSSQLYFLSEHSQAVLRAGHYLTFKTGGWEVDSKRWGLVWSSDSAQHSLPGLRLKQVRVITKSGESLLANTFQ